MNTLPQLPHLGTHLIIAFSRLTCASALFLSGWKLHTMKMVSQSERLMNCDSESAIWHSSCGVVERRLWRLWELRQSRVRGGLGRWKSTRPLSPGHLGGWLLSWGHGLVIKLPQGCTTHAHAHAACLQHQPPPGAPHATHQEGGVGVERHVVRVVGAARRVVHERAVPDLVELQQYTVHLLQYSTWAVKMMSWSPGPSR